MAPTFNDNNLKGIDVYHGDQNLSYHDLSANGVKFAFIKASQGVSMSDPAYSDNRSRANSVGILTGAYHFFMPLLDPITQAEHFLNSSNLKQGDIRHCLDIEVNGSDIGERALDCAEYIKKQTGLSVIPYSSDSFYQSYLKSHFPEDDYTLWIARYGAKPATTCKFWQFSDRQYFPENPPLDANIFYGSIEDLQNLCL